MKITIDYLKQESCNFDLETVFILDLSRKDIKDLDGIKECSNIEILNLSNNEINDLSALKGLNKLQYLNLSFNQIKYLDGLESLESLKSLNLSGNHLDNLNEFYKLKYLENLTQLTLNDIKNVASNPICKYNSYKHDIGRILPKLEAIDGECLKTSNKNMLKNFYESLNSENINLNSNEDFDIQNCSEGWLNNAKEFNSMSTKTCIKNQNLINEQRELFKNLYDDISKSIQKTNESLTKIESEFKSTSIN